MRETEMFLDSKNINTVHRTEVPVPLLSSASKQASKQASTYYNKCLLLPEKHIPLFFHLPAARKEFCAVPSSFEPCGESSVVKFSARPLFFYMPSNPIDGVKKRDPEGERSFFVH